MDEIEKGFEKLMKKIEELQEKNTTLSEKVRANDAKLLAKMSASAVPVVKIVGLSTLKMGKQDTKGEIYDPMHLPAEDDRAREV